MRYEISLEDWTESLICFFTEDLIKQKKFSRKEILSIAESFVEAHEKALFAWTPKEESVFSPVSSTRARCLYCGEQIARPIMRGIDAMIHTGVGEFDPSKKPSVNKSCEEIEKIHERNRTALARALKSAVDALYEKNTVKAS